MLQIIPPALILNEYRENNPDQLEKLIVLCTVKRVLSTRFFAMESKPPNQLNLLRFWCIPGATSKKLD